MTSRPQPLGIEISILVILVLLEYTVVFVRKLNGEEKICYTNTYVKFWGSKSWEISPALFPWNLREEKEISLFHKFMIT